MFSYAYCRFNDVDCIIVAILVYIKDPRVTLWLAVLLILDPLAFNSYRYFLVVKLFSAPLELPLNIWSYKSVIQGKSLLTKALGPQVIKHSQLIENPLLPSFFVTKYKYIGLQVRVFYSVLIDYFEMIGDPLPSSMSVANVNILNLKVGLTGVRQPQWWRWDLMLVKTKNSWISVKLSITYLTL